MIEGKRLFPLHKKKVENKKKKIGKDEENSTKYKQRTHTHKK